ncbi:hydrophobic surface binding protein [Moelleriella libera RCEF 2490]|uniref:Cell wall mannoprotein 1 n=1 Tax=Moelleriella libera RCEF 2490 TaxID=1081109 RepID=A0A168FA66_9HYPO|nr:hydrophobic surface binding protein [Moelleriella libera RCEF 2490]
MLSIKNLLFLAVAATGSVIIKRDVETVKQDLRTINDDTTAVTAAVNNYNGGGFAAAIPIVNAQNKLSRDIRSATTDAQNAGPASEADADDIIGYITNTLEPNIKTTLSALKSKKSKFDADGLSGTVKSSLQNLKSDTDKLSAALVSASPSSRAQAAQSIANTIDADFDDAIAYFS